MDDSWRGALPPLSARFRAAYEILRPLGEGGMGVVYVARQHALGREVALKLLRHLSDEERGRFEREARALASLHHPGILRVVDAGCDGDVPYLVTELVDGTSLQARLRSGPLPRPEALAVLSVVAEALAFAHDRGIVHRDVKPDNVLLSVGGAARLADFGLARAVEPGKTLTAPGLILGTPEFLAPELIRGERATPATDQYAWGVTAFYALTGRLPITGQSVGEIMTAHLTAAVPALQTLAPDVPLSLDRAVSRALAKLPADRHAGMAAVARILADLREPAAPRGRRGPRVTRRGPWVALSLATALLGAAWLALSLSAPPPPPSAPLSAPLSPRARFEAIAPLLERIHLLAMPAPNESAVAAAWPAWNAAARELAESAPRLIDEDRAALSWSERQALLSAAGTLRHFDALCRRHGRPQVSGAAIQGGLGPGARLSELADARRIWYKGSDFLIGPGTQGLRRLDAGRVVSPSAPVPALARAWLEVEVAALEPRDAAWVHLDTPAGRFSYFIDETCLPTGAPPNSRATVGYHALDPDLVPLVTGLSTERVDLDATHKSRLVSVNTYVILGSPRTASGPPPLRLTLAGTWHYQTQRTESGAYERHGDILFTPTPTGYEARILEPVFNPTAAHLEGSRLRVDRLYGPPPPRWQTWFLTEDHGALTGHLIGESGNEPSDLVILTR